MDQDEDRQALMMGPIGGSREREREREKEQAHTSTREQGECECKRARTDRVDGPLILCLNIADR
jgi:hypothetical protein